VKAHLVNATAGLPPSEHQTGLVMQSQLGDQKRLKNPCERGNPLLVKSVASTKAFT